jgi:Sulfotransferase domain
VKVFGIGLARTGTSSLNRALKQLGLTSKHFPREYEAALQYECLTDTSVTIAYKYLDFMFPGSKFILTIRADDEWLDSMAALLNHLHAEGIADRYHRLHLALYGTTGYDEVQLRRAYWRHYEDVTTYFADRPADLLVLDVTRADAYQALARFLGRAPVTGAFPHLNSRLEMTSSRPALHA